MELTVLDNKMPLRGYPEPKLDEALKTVFKFWLSRLLSIKADNEEKLDSALPAIKTHFWSLGMNDVKKAFEMYADGQLSTKPRSNHIDRILVGQIFNDYKMHNRQVNKPTTEFDKEAQDFMYCITAFDYFQQNTALPEQAVWLYEYLTEKDVLNVSDKQKLKSYKSALGKYQNVDVATLKSKLWLVEHFFSTLLAKDKHIKDQL
ncbi:MAG: hypothetical protein GY928_18660 [Colwellia sp.]|nr:hypothetical protein [Colwellia sp.]